MAVTNPMAEINGRLADQTRQGTAPWQRPWPAAAVAAFNPVSGAHYHGFNQIALAARQFDDPRWLSLRQANQNNLRVKRGEVGQKLAFWQMEEGGQPLERPVLRYVTVFNARQLQLENGQDLAPYELEAEAADKDRQPIIDLLGKSGVKLSQDVADGQPDWYDVKADEIHVKGFGQYGSMDHFYMSALTCLARATAHPQRLDRYVGPAGTPTQAKEELLVRVSSWLLGREYGLPFEPGQPGQFEEQWAAAIGATPYGAANLAREAEKVKEYVKTMDLEKTREAEKPRPYAPKTTSQLDPVEEFAQALQEAGLKLAGPPQMDGQIHRVPVEGGRGGAKDGSYKAYSDGRPNGWIDNFKTGYHGKWIATGQVMTQEQKERMRAEMQARVAKRQQEREAGYAQAMAQAAERFGQAKFLVGDHPYLKAKGVENFGLKVDGQGNLLVPGYDMAATPPKLQTIQSISPRGDKVYEKGCPSQLATPGT